jgi:hypothetical protein
MALQINHPGMSKEFFDLGVKRAMDAELCIQKTARASVVAVSSSQDPDLSYLVTREFCSCEGGRRHGRGMIFMKDIMGGFGSPQSAPVFIHRRSNPRPAA